MWLLSAFGLVVGCTNTGSESMPAPHSKSELAATCDSLFPRHAKDIEVLYCWGVGGRNRLDTISGTITKDLVADPAITVQFELSDQDRETIVQFADSIGFWRLPEVISPPDTLEIIEMMTPCSDHLLRISQRHRTKTVRWDTCYQNPCAERERVAPLGALVKRLVTEAEEYGKLPKIRGGYL